MSSKDTEGDSVIILSSELIATVMERYFNDTMFKLPVSVVDLSPSASGYAFTLAFQSQSDIPTLPTMSDMLRGKNGRFKGRRKVVTEQQEANEIYNIHVNEPQETD